MSHLDEFSTGPAAGTDDAGCPLLALSGPGLSHCERPLLVGKADRLNAVATALQSDPTEHGGESRGIAKNRTYK